MVRIGFADHLFLRMHHGIGNPVFNQFLWLFDTPISGETLEKLHANLSAGLLSRAVARPIVPTARHRWVTSDAALPLELSSPIPSDAVRCWAEQRVSDRIDPESGLGWQLSAAPLASGGMVVSLVCSHMVADGAAMVAAVRHANRDSTTLRSSDLGSAPPLLNVLVDDVVDTFGELKPVVKWATGKVAAALPGSRDVPTAAPVITEAPRRSVVDENTDPWSPPYVVVECSASDWHVAAAEWGGTSNSMFIGMMTALAASLGRARPGDELRWSLPYSDRDIDALDSNSTKIVAVRVPVSDDGDRDLTRIRAASKAAFTEFAARQTSKATTEAIPLSLIQMLPDVVVSRLPMPADGAEGLVSNLGRIPDDFSALGGVRARSVAARATFYGADATFARSMGGGSTAWATETEDAVTITLHGMDPDRMHSDDDLRNAVADVLTRWRISHRFW